MDGQVLTVKDVLARICIARATLYHWIAIGTFPKPIKLGPKRVGFRGEEIERWLSTRPTVEGR